MRLKWVMECVANSDRNEITIRHNSKTHLEFIILGSVMNSTCVSFIWHGPNALWHQIRLKPFYMSSRRVWFIFAIHVSASLFIFCFLFSTRALMIYMPFLLFTFAPCTSRMNSRIFELDISDKFLSSTSLKPHHTTLHCNVYKLCQP